MTRMIQIRNVPNSLHCTLKARGAMAAMSPSDYLLINLQEMAKRRTLEDLRERLHKRAAVSIPLDTARSVHEERELLRRVAASGEKATIGTSGR
jgi:hypothetical protein